MAIELVYVGGGSSLIGVPTKNLSHEEVKRFGGKEFLLGSGLYAEPYKKPTKSALKDTQKVGEIEQGEN